MIWFETALSFAMGTIGAYLLYRGKKIQEPKMMLLGGVLIVLSYFLFGGWGKDDASNADLTKLMPKAADTQSLPQP